MLRGSWREDGGRPARQGVFRLLAGPLECCPLGRALGIYAPVLSHLILAGASWSMTAFCPLFVPFFFKTLLSTCLVPYLVPGTGTTVMSKTESPLSSHRKP